MQLYAHRAQVLLIYKIRNNMAADEHFARKNAAFTYKQLLKVYMIGVLM